MNQMLKTFRSYFDDSFNEKIDLRDFKIKLAKAAQKKLTDGVFGATKKTKGHFQVIDFFSGTGGMSAGFYALSKLIPGSFEILGGIDINKEALNTFSKNFVAPGVIRDVRDLKNERELEVLKKELGRDNTKPLILIGCAPCQGFTSHRKKTWSEKDDRNNLISSFVKMAIQLDPVCIVMENVPEMFSRKYKNYYQAAKKKLEEAGYDDNVLSVWMIVNDYRIDGTESFNTFF
jgi:DNA (cytosine-5)-methyltransferase 1